MKTFRTKNHGRWVALLGVVSFVAGCMPHAIGRAQSASTLGKGKHEAAVDLRYQALINGFLGGSFRYGVADNVDVGVRALAAFPAYGASSLDLSTKFQFTPKDSWAVVAFEPSVNFSLPGVGSQMTVLLGAKAGKHEFVFTPHVALHPWEWTGRHNEIREYLGVGASLGFYARCSDNFRIMPEVGVRLLPFNRRNGAYDGGPVRAEFGLAFLFGN
ncbi:MAG: hypothetical protein ACKVPX_10760 [Myxococcaceae bacterium]